MEGNLNYVLGCFLFDNPLWVTDAIRFINMHALPIISEGCLHGILTIVIIIEKERLKIPFVFHATCCT